MATSAKRLVRNFNVSASEAEFCTQILLARLNEKSRGSENFIVPQKPDWLEHQMLADTKGWNKFIESDFPALKNNRTSHVLIEDHVLIENSNRTSSISIRFDRAKESYHHTIERLKTEYGLDCISQGMTESGWDNPAYDLKNGVTSAFQGMTFSKSKKERLNLARAALCPEIVSLFEWLPSRLTKRFLVSDDVAALATVAYADFFTRFDSGLWNFRLPALLTWAWFEHVIFTDQYKKDCNLVRGSFFHRPHFDFLGTLPNRTDLSYRFTLAPELEGVLNSGGHVTADC